MKISCAGAGKRFNRDWIFRNFSYEFLPGGHYAITGPNGAGKSTLLQVIAGAVVTSEGNITYTQHNRQLLADHVHTQLSIAAPYLDIIEEMTLREFLQFHQVFKPFLKELAVGDIIAMVHLEKAAAKQIRYFSSGMKQRVKLAQALFSDTSCILLDEPCTNLDEAGIQLYQQLITRFCAGRMVIVSSNDRQEYSFCTDVLNIMDYK